jgi:hypothetical protein
MWNDDKAIAFAAARAIRSDARMNKSDGTPEKTRKRSNFLNIEVLAALIVLSTMTWFILPYVAPFLVPAVTCGKVSLAPCETPALGKMQVCRDSALRLYNGGHSAEGDKRIADGLKIGVSSKSSPSEVDMYACLLQERAQEHHLQFLDGKGKDNGVKDQLASLAVLEKYLPGDNAPILYKLSLLGRIYAENGDAANADKTWGRAIPMAKRLEVSPQSASAYAYTAMGRSKAVQHEYKQGFAAMQTAEKISGDTSDPPWQFELGCQFDSRKDPLKQVPTLFKEQKFDQLDAMFDSFTKSRARTPMGRWKTSWMVSKLDDDNSLKTESAYARHFDSLNKWIESNPKSVLARLAKAETLVGYAWLARGSGNADTVSASGWQQMRERLQQAKAILDADPTLKAKSPTTFSIYQRIALGEQTDRKEYFKLVSECDSLWPESFQAHASAAYFLLPRWYGQSETEWVEYMEHVSDKLGGSKGDVCYAEIAADLMRWNFCNNLFEESPRLSWARIDKGFRQIFHDHPHDGAAVSAYIKLATQAHKQDQIAEALP